MATAQIILDTRYKAKDNSYPLVVRVISERRSRNIKTGVRVLKYQWKGGMVVKHPEMETINSILADKVSEYRRLLYECIKNDLDIIDAIDGEKVATTYNAYFEKIIKRKKSHNKKYIARKLENILDDINDCFKVPQAFNRVNIDWISKLHAHMLKKGNVNNTVHKKMQLARQVFEKARREEVTNARNNFYDYTVKKNFVPKPKLSLAEIKKLEELEIADGVVNDSRNLFLFAYYCKGQRFGAAASAKWSDIKEGRVYFPLIGKSGKFISVKVHSRLEAIIEFYRGKSEGEYIFPRFANSIASMNTICNRNLNTLGPICGLNIKLTHSIARHTFAYHMKVKGASEAGIKDSMGHSSSRTTQIYLKSLEDEYLDVETDKLYG